MHTYALKGKYYGTNVLKNNWRKFRMNLCIMFLVDYGEKKIRYVWYKSIIEQANCNSWKGHLPVSQLEKYLVAALLLAHSD